MITAELAVSWLNWEQPSHLLMDSLVVLREIIAPGTNVERKQFLLDELENCTEGMTDPLERAEVFVYLSKEWLQLACLERARKLAQDAKLIYESSEGKDPHRQAISAWMMHLILLKQFEYVSAFSNASMARVTFRERADTYKNGMNYDLMNWYHERINEMTVDLVSYPEEAFEWMTKYRGSYLSGAAQEIQKSIRANIQKKNYSLVYQQMDMLCEATQKVIDARETSEAFAFCGLTAAQMGNIQQGVVLLKKAQSLGTQTSHEYACIRWILGLIQMRLPKECSKGMANLETGIKYFASLREDVDHQNKPDARDWYAIQIAAMRSVIKNLIELTMRPGPNLVA